MPSRPPGGFCRGGAILEPRERPGPWRHPMPRNRQEDPMNKPLPRVVYADEPDVELARRVAQGDQAAFEARIRGALGVG